MIKIQIIKIWFKSKCFKTIQVFMKFVSFYKRFINKFNSIAASLIKVIAKKREEMRNLASRISREEFFFNFPFFMKKGNFFWGISLFACGKERDFFEFPFSYEKKSEKKKMIFYLLKRAKSVIFCEKGKRFFSRFPLRGKKISISLPSWEKGRECLPISLLNGHPVSYWYIEKIEKRKILRKF